MLGGHGGRLDHLLANVLLLARPEHADVDGHRADGRRPGRRRPRRAPPCTARSATSSRSCRVHGPARGVTTTGLLYPLAGEDLPAGTTRGVSNELVHDPATVTLTDGVLVAIQPGQLGTHHQETPR